MFKNNTLSITITNQTTQTQPWVAFGYNKGVQNVPGVMVSVSESSLQESDRQSASIPFKVQSIKIRTQNNAQLSMPIQIITSDATGQKQQYSLMPADYLEPDSKIPNLVKINNPNIIISSQVQLQGVIQAGQTMTVAITIKKQSAFSNFISNIFSPVANKKVIIRWRLLPD